MSNFDKGVGVVSWKNAGKTLLIELTRHLTSQGLRVATVKHAHHAFDIDHEGKDSFAQQKRAAARSYHRLDPALGT